MNGQVRWFAYEAVQEGLLDTDTCRQLARELGEEADLLAFAQAVVDRGLVSDPARVQAMLDRVAARSEADGPPPVDVFAEPGPAAAVPATAEPAAPDAGSAGDGAGPFPLVALLYAPFGWATLQPVLAALALALLVTVGVPWVALSTRGETAAVIALVVVTMPSALLFFLVRFLERAKPVGEVEATLNSGFRMWSLLALTLAGFALPLGGAFRAAWENVQDGGVSAILSALAGLPIIVAVALIWPQVNLRILLGRPTAGPGPKATRVLTPFVLVLAGYVLFACIGMAVFAAGFSLLWSKTRIASAPDLASTYRSFTNALVYSSSFTALAFLAMVPVVGAFYYAHYAAVCLFYGKAPLGRRLKPCLRVLPHLVLLLVVTAGAWYPAAKLSWDPEAQRYDRARQQYRELVAKARAAERSVPPRTVTNSQGQKYIEVPPGLLIIRDDSTEPSPPVGPDRFTSLCYGFLRLGRTLTFSVMSGRRQLAQVFSGTGEPYALAETEVSQAQWRQVMGYDLAGEYQPNLPVQGVSAGQARQFAARLGAMENHTCEYALPSRAQWLNAWKQGQSPAGWNQNTSGGKVHPVGEGQADQLGLKDLLGNVPEWCDGRIRRRADFPAHLRLHYALTVQGHGGGWFGLVGGGWQDAPFDPLANAITPANPRPDSGPLTPPGFRLCRSPNPPARPDARILYQPVLTGPLMPAAEFAGPVPLGAALVQRETVINAIQAPAALGKVVIGAAHWVTGSGKLLALLSQSGPLGPMPVAGVIVEPGRPSAWVEWPTEAWFIGVDATGALMASCRASSTPSAGTAAAMRTFKGGRAVYPFGTNLTTIVLRDLRQGKTVAEVDVYESNLTLIPVGTRLLSADGRYAVVPAEMAAGEGFAVVLVVVDLQARTVGTLDVLADLRLSQWAREVGCFVSAAGHTLYVPAKGSMVAVDLATCKVTDRFKGFLPRGHVVTVGQGNATEELDSGYTVTDLTTDAAGNVLVLTMDPAAAKSLYRADDPRQQDGRQFLVLRRNGAKWATAYSRKQNAKEFPPALAALSQDGRMLAVSTARELVLVDLTQSDRQIALDGHESSVVGRPVFSPDRKLLATAGSQITLWYLGALPEFR